MSPAPLPQCSSGSALTYHYSCNNFHARDNLSINNDLVVTRSPSCLFTRQDHDEGIGSSAGLSCSGQVRAVLIKEKGKEKKRGSLPALSKSQHPFFANYLNTFFWKRPTSRDSPLTWQPRDAGIQQAVRQATRQETGQLPANHSPFDSSFFLDFFFSSFASFFASFASLAFLMSSKSTNSRTAMGAPSFTLFLV